MSSKQLAANAMRFLVTDPLNGDEENVEYQHLQKLMVKCLEWYEKDALDIVGGSLVLHMPSSGGNDG